MAPRYEERVLSRLAARAVLDGLHHPVVVADDRGRIVYVNEACARLLGWRPDDLVGSPLTVLMPHRFQARHREAFERFIATGTSAFVGSGGIAVPALHRDGTEVEVQLDVDAHDLGDGSIALVATMRDLSDRVALERERHTSQYLAAMRAITSRLALSEPTGADLRDVAPVLVETMGEALDWDIGAVWLVEGDEVALAHRWAAPGAADDAARFEHEGLRFHLGEGLPGRVVATGEPAWIADIASDWNFPRREIAIECGLASCFAFPIIVHGRVVAVAEMSSRQRRLPDPDLLAALLSGGAEIGRFLERQRSQAESARVQSDLVELAEALQASLLPPHVATIPGMDVAFRYRAAGAGQVGGDFFDVFPLGDGEWAVAIGDVCGRGPRAAALTALARYTIRGAAVGSSTPSAVLQALNDVVVRELEQSGEDRFLTVAVVTVRLRPDGAALTIASGGHPPVLVRRADGGVDEIGPTGGLVGTFESLEITDTTIHLGPGDTALLYTDGAIEARGDDGPFGEGRLRALVAATDGDGADGLVTAVDAAVRAHSSGSAQDDLALVALHLPGVPATAVQAVVTMPAPA